MAAISENPGEFKTTRWSMVLAAGGAAETARPALETLCSTYWYPLYVYVRQRSFGAEDAQDITQEFFAHFLEKCELAALSPQRGRFRAYLLASINNFVANEWDKRATQKRGGGARRLSLDMLSAEERYKLELPARLTPEKIFERRWACEVLNRTFATIQKEFQNAGKEILFESLKFALTGEAQPETYARIAETTGFTEPMLKSAVHRLRRRYAEILKEEIAQTVERAEDIDDEVAFLFSALAQE